MPSFLNLLTLGFLPTREKDVNRCHDILVTLEANLLDLQEHHNSYNTTELNDLLLRTRNLLKHETRYPRFDKDPTREQELRQFLERFSLSCPLLKKAVTHALET